MSFSHSSSKVEETDLPFGPTEESWGGWEADCSRAKLPHQAPQYPQQLVPQDAWRRPPNVGPQHLPRRRLKPQPQRMINPIPTNPKLCNSCQNIDFDLLVEENALQPHQQAFRALERSAETCALCALLFNSIQKRDEFPASQNSRIWLKGFISAGTIYGIKAVYNCPDPGPQLDEQGNEIVEWISWVLEEPEQPGIFRVEGKVLDIVADPASIATMGDVMPGRLIHPAHDMMQAREWLADCETNHSNCKPSRGTAQERSFRAGPSRLLDVGEPNLVRLAETNSQAVEYLALSYRWPHNATVMTTKENIVQHFQHIGILGLSKTIRDAIYVTRGLRFRYLWIDSLCIVQNDETDWANEAANMANIYQLATLTLSASVSTANDEGLILPRRATNDVRLPYNRSDVDTPSFVLATDRSWEPTSEDKEVPSTFDADVSHGALSRRGWCLQERVLSHRILHFGKDQLHWECLEGCQSEASAGLHSLNLCFPEGRLRGPLLSGLTFLDFPPEADQPSNFQIPPHIVSMGLDSVFRGLGGPARFSDEPYASWYSLVAQYSERELTRASDKLVALSGVARVFSSYAEDEYVAGLWQGDLVRGLLWSSASSADKPLLHPAEPRRPTWSWVSVDGPIQWPHPLYGGKVGNPDFQWATAHRTPATQDEFGTVSIAFLRLSGRVRRMAGMRGFHQEYFEWLQANEENIDYDCNPIPIIDGFDLHLDELHCLLISSVDCHPNCRHAVGCDSDGMAWALMLLQFNGENMYTEAGIVQPGSVYARAGLAKVFQSSFSGTPFQDIVLI